MSLPVIKCFTNALRLSRCVRNRSALIATASNPLQISPATSQAKSLQFRRSSSLWSLSSHSETRPFSHVSEDTSVTGWSRRCGCCALHTTGDKELTQFLEEEIQLEKKNEKSSPKLGGFDVTSDGAEVTLTKKLDNEMVTVKFNVNHSIEDEGAMELDQSPKEEEPSMLSKPAFVVEINKGGPLTLAMQCVFPMSDEGPPPTEGDQEHYVDVIEIQDVTLLKKGQEWEDAVYTVSGSVMDGNLYDMMLTLLEERGIDGDFIEQFVKFSTSYEHKQYINLLMDMQSFVNEK